MKRAVVAGWLLIFLAVCARGRAEVFPSSVTAEEAESLPAEREMVRTAPGALLVVPSAGIEQAASDPRDNASFQAVCYAYVMENGPYVRRFAVHTQDRDLLPIARRAARFLAVLWGAANRRFGTLSQKLRQPVDVWMMRSGAAGGEQFRNNLYLYDVFAERAGIEWARELAHEYGHYLLPSPSGYTEPESWANGVLGERLFLKWVQDDLSAGRLDAAEVPYVKAANLEEYCAKQVTPLIERYQRNGPDPALLAQTDRRAMNAFTGLMLYADETYGGAALLDMLAYLPRDRSGKLRGPDFLRAFQGRLDSAAGWTTRIGANGLLMVYLPRGSFRVKAAGSPPKALRFDRDVSAARGAEGWSVRVPASGWRRISVEGAPVSLKWEKR